MACESDEGIDMVEQERVRFRVRSNDKHIIREPVLIIEENKGDCCQEEQENQLKFQAFGMHTLIVDGLWDFCPEIRVFG